jgi:D-tyrosyl-tRNA(Tyr) deacylase
VIAVVQRVSRAEVRIAGREPARIGRGLLVLLGVARGDDEGDAEWLARKCLALRIFGDDDDRMNRGLEDVGGGLLVVSQFTLLGDCVKGRRPSWSDAAEPGAAERLYESFVERLRRSPFAVETGVFQARMEVDAVNEGPVTLILDSRRARAAAAPSAETLLRAGREPLVLASRSPRRASLLTMLGVPYTVREPHEDAGRWQRGEEAAGYAMGHAEAKALSVARGLERGVALGADTVVVLDGEVLEKPADAAEAAAHLRRLQGREHEVVTGVCLARAGGDRRVVGCERSRVRMSALDAAAIAAYVATGEPLDKAGGYGIQGVGGLLIERVEGCYFNVMGLPLARLRALFSDLEEGP